MTEIVADKTVEVVKNAIETADGALDLYNKYLVSGHPLADL